MTESITESNRKYILLVDDDPVSLEVLTAQVRRLGHEVISTQTLGEARSAAVDADLVIADLRLPDGEGWELAPMTDAPVCILTGLATGEQTRTALDAGCVEVLEKPVRRAELQELLQRHLPNAPPDLDL